MDLERLCLDRLGMSLDEVAEYILRKEEPPGAGTPDGSKEKNREESLMTTKTLYHKKKIHARAAALILTGGILLGGSVLGGRDTARAVEDEPAQVGFLLIAGMAPQTEEPLHPVLTFRASDPALCVGIEAPEEAAPEVAVEVPVEAAPEVVLSDEDVDLLARITMAEAESESELGKRLVIDTVLNRMEDSRFPDTVSGVIYQPHQFTPVENGRLSRCYVQDEIRDLVLEECMTRTNRECLYFQRGSSCPWGTLLLHEGGHYFFK